MENLSKKDLLNLDLHDQELVSFKIDFANRNIEMQMSVYNDVDARYKRFTLFFFSVSEWEFSSFAVRVTDWVEVSHHRVAKSESGSGYSFEMTLLCGFGNPSWEISFNFMECQIQNWI